MSLFPVPLHQDLLLKHSFLCGVTWYQPPSVWDLVMKPWSFLPLLSWHFEHGCDKQGVDLTETVENETGHLHFSPISLGQISRSLVVWSDTTLPFCHVFFCLGEKTLSTGSPFNEAIFGLFFFLIMLLWTLTFKVLTDACFCIFGLLTNK